MTLPVANVDITTDTFGIWVVKTNTLAHFMSNYVVTVDQTSSGNSSTGNGYVVGNFGATTLFANSVLRGGNVSTTGTLNISSNVSLANTITISGASVLSNTLAVTGNVNLSNTFTVTGASVLSNTLTVTGFANVISTLDVTGATTLKSTLSVNNALTASNTLAVTGLTSLNGNVNTPTANATTAINVGANVNANTISLRVGGGVTNTVITNNTITVGNNTVNTVINATSFSGTSANATNLNSQPASFYTNATNLTSGTLDTARLPATANVTTAINVGANVNLTTSRITVGNSTVNTFSNSTVYNVGNTTIAANLITTDYLLVRNDLTVNGNFFVSATLTANGSLIPAANNNYDLGSTANTFRAAYIVSLNSNSGAFGSVISVGNSTVNSVINSSSLTTSTANLATTLSVGANVVLTTSTITVGNSTVNAVINTTAFSGRANTANTLVTPRNIQITGDVSTVNTAFNGSADISLTVTLANTTVTPGTYTKVTVDSKGRITTGASANSVDIIGSLGYTPANRAGDTFTGNTQFNANVTLVNTILALTNTSIFANGSLGTAAQVLHSNGTGTYWATDDQGVTSVASGAGLTGGTITTTGTLAVIANSGIIANTTGVYVNANSGLLANATGVYVNANTGIVANSTGLFVNATYIATIPSNTANQLTTARNIQITGDVVTTNTAFNGTTNVSLTVTLANTSVTAGEYSKVTVDSKGRVTAGAYIANTDVISALTYTPLSSNSSGTIDGNLTLAGTATGRSIIFDTTDVRLRQIIARTGGVNRWLINIADNTAETGSDAGSNFSVSKYNDAASTNTVVMAINRSTGNFSFGTPTPLNDTKIRIHSDSTYESGNGIYLLNGNNDSRSSIDIRFHAGSGGGFRGALRGGRSASGTNNGELILTTGLNGTEREVLRLDSDKTALFYGNVYIANSNLSVGVGDVGEKNIIFSNSVRSAYFYLDTSGNFGLFDFSANTSKWVSNTTQGFTLPSNLVVGGSVQSNQGYVFVGDTDTGMVSGGNNIINFRSNNLTLMTMLPGSVNVVNTAANSSVLLDPNGRALFYSNNSIDNHGFNIYIRNGTTIGSITQTGSGTQVSFNTSSDYRLKTDINSVKNASDIVKKLNIHNFAWKSAPEVRQDGFLAHELQQHIPYAVTGEKDAVDANGNIIIQQVDNSKLVPILAASLQEALIRIDELEKKR